MVQTLIQPIKPYRNRRLLYNLHMIIIVANPFL